MHILGGLEKDSDTGAISTEPENHNLMCRLRAEKVAKIPVPDVKVQGCVEDADLLIVGFGGTYGHLYSAMEEDEYVEVTPKSMRMRKVILDETERKRANKS
jgi:2-oxoglutarate/2-oxoacid ferredoxin oxidoreductase subunit alpha